VRRLITAVFVTGLGAAFLGTSALCAQASDTARASFPGPWVVGATEGPVFCLVFSPDSTATLVSGHTRETNYRWSYDPASGNLTLILPRTYRDFTSMLNGAVGYQLVSFDTLTRATVQYVRDGQMWLMGYTLFPASTLDSTEYAVARRGCRLPPRRETPRPTLR
jgi:hypothetical protein